MRTLRIDLDQRLLAAAADIMGTADSNATVNEALRRIVVHERQLRNLERLMADSVFSTDPPTDRGSALDPDSIFSTDPPTDSVLLAEST
ncbi:type II toxin-antitoxin system VapB family antitoxin [Nocardia salmonicida]|uniref:type II toxin-antitoxin system VapB family antitoxin n=1 Tax=Nocardia salmonicida TaxID=53431 RepID=UPI00364D750B